MGRWIKGRVDMDRISPAMTLLDIVELWPDTEEVLRDYEKVTGTCLLCQHLFDSVQSFAALYEIDLEELMRRLSAGNNKEGVTQKDQKN